MVDDEKGELHIIWDVDDIFYAAANMEAGSVSLSREDAVEILHDLDRNHDSKDGINWQTVSRAIREHIATKDCLTRRAVNYGS